MKRWAALACCLAALAHATDVVDVERASVVTRGGRSLELDGGVWLSNEYAQGYARELTSLRVENTELKKAPAPGWVVVVTAVASAAAFAAGFVVGHR